MSARGFRLQDAAKPAANASVVSRERGRVHVTPRHCLDGKTRRAQLVNLRDTYSIFSASSAATLARALPSSSPRVCDFVVPFHVDVDNVAGPQPQ